MTETAKEKAARRKAIVDRANANPHNKPKPEPKKTVKKKKVVKKKKPKAKVSTASKRASKVPGVKKAGKALSGKGTADKMKQLGID